MKPLIAEDGDGGVSKAGKKEGKGKREKRIHARRKEK